MSTTNSRPPTYEAMLEHHNLSSSQLQVQCPDHVLRSLAKKMTRWKNIAVDLEVDESAVETIEKEKDEEGKGRKLLERWKEIFGHEATFERLARCLVNSKRANLADFVCEECKKLVAEGGKKEELPAPTDCHPFTTQADGEEGQSQSRDIPMKKHEVDTVGPGGVAHPPGPLKHNQSTESVNVSREEQSNGNQTSRMVAPTAATSIPPDPQLNPPESPMSPTQYNTMTNIWTMSLEHMKSLSTFITSEKEDKKAIESRLSKKEEELEERKKKVEACLSDKDKEIQSLSDEAENMKSKLNREEEKQEQVKQDLTEKEKEIDILQDEISWKDRELKEVREDQQEKCGRLAELEKQLKEARDKMDKEKGTKEEIEKQLMEVTKRYKKVQKAYEKVDNEVVNTRKEKETLKHVLRWTGTDLEDEKKERDEIMELIGKIEHQKKICIYIIMALLFIIAGFILL